VIGFAQRMIRDHTQTSQALAQATASAGLKPPPKSVGAANAPFLAALQSLRAREFDQGYWRQQMLAHAAALVVEQKYAATGDTPSVRQAAAAAVPVIQAHLTMAQQMASRTANGS
jgi:putative membrane protein